MAKDGKFKKTKKQLRKDKVPATPLEWGKAHLTRSTPHLIQLSLTIKY